MEEKLRVLAMYLPQFHRIPENDKWWGDGFTEWVAVKRSLQLFEGHEQPRFPLNDNYYDLMDRKTMEWQAKMAEEYKIDGFCFYHYWFKDGRKVLEKPAENLLKWKDINMPFCFCWDPISWARTWTGMGNSWSDVFEKQGGDNGEYNGILLEQKYGGYIDWEKHFYYFLPFFIDRRYIKKDNKPVLMICAARRRIYCISQMIECWRNLAAKEKLPGIYVIVLGLPTPEADAVVFPMSYFGPGLWGYDKEITQIIPGTSIKGQDYEAVWQNYLGLQPTAVQPTLWTCMPSYDDTPRRGQNGSVFIGSSPKKFKKYFGLLVEKSLKMNNPFLFIDAWNEWGEGKYLEPDKLNGYGYLEAVRDIMSKDEKILEQYNQEYYRVHSYAKMQKNYIHIVQKQLLEYQLKFYHLSEWMDAVFPKNKIKEYLCICKYKNVAIYGFGEDGKRLLYALSGQEIKVTYIIDRRKLAIQNSTPLPVYNIIDNLPICDVIIISIIAEYSNIESLLKKKVNCPIVSLAEIVAEARKLNGYR